MRCGSSQGTGLAFLICFSGAVTAAEGQNVIHVDAGATERPRDGSSWCSAFAELQEALEVARAGDKIVVAHGTYKPDRGTGNRAATFQLIRGVGVHGGFAGCGALDPNENNPALYETILSGDLDGDDGPDFTGYDDNTYHVVTAIFVNSATALEGVTVTGGNADGPNFGPSPDSKDQGSAVNNYFGTLRLANCIFRENRAANHGTVNDHGGATLENCEFRNNLTGMWAGALFIFTDVVTTVDNCRFYNNVTGGTAGGGGAVANGANTIFTNCLFADNRSETNGGAVYNHSGAAPTLSHCTFQSNTATNPNGRGGAIYNDVETSPAITACAFLGNSATRGGAVYNFRQSNPSLVECTFALNTASVYGGAIANRDNTLTMVSTDLIGNTATNAGGAVTSIGSDHTLRSCRFLGNAAAVGGGLQTEGEGTMEMTNCIFSANSATRGGGMSNGTDAFLVNCSFSRNSASDIGGGMYSANALEVEIHNSIFWDNFGGGGTDEPGQIYSRLDQQDDVPVRVFYSCVQGLTPALGGIGNIGEAPRFVDADGWDDTVGTDDDDLRLLRGSPCIDTGDNEALGASVTTDLAGNARVINGFVDMGALEGAFEAPAPIPAVSQWGIVILGLLLVAFGGRRILPREPHGEPSR